MVSIYPLSAENFVSRRRLHARSRERERETELSFQFVRRKYLRLQPRARMFSLILKKSLGSVSEVCFLS